VTTAALVERFAPRIGSSGVVRTVLSDAVNGRLYFAQVREDPRLEIEALRASQGGRHVVVGSGGCTALSLLAAGADEVVAVDTNSSQNHIIELKVAAASILDFPDSVGFLGGYEMTAPDRFRRYAALRGQLSPAAAAYWDSRRVAIEGGVVRSGVSEKFIGLLAGLVRATVHPRRRIERLLACTTLEDQSQLYDEEWNSVRWRALFRVLLNRWTLKRTYEPGFFTHVENSSFSSHFHGLFERTIREVPVASNYFLHQMLTGSYPRYVADGVPPYLDRVAEPGAFSGLELVDGSYQRFLVSCEDSSVDGLALSNICEWLPPAEIESLFASAVRVAKPGARIVFRNFVGHTVMPAWLRDVIVEDEAAGAAAIRRDRSCVQARIVICTVRKAS